MGSLGKFCSHAWLSIIDSKQAFEWVQLKIVKYGEVRRDLGPYFMKWARSLCKWPTKSEGAIHQVFSLPLFYVLMWGEKRWCDPDGLSMLVRLSLWMPFICSHCSVKKIIWHTISHSEKQENLYRSTIIEYFFSEPKICRVGDFSVYFTVQILAVISEEERFVIPYYFKIPNVF